MSTKKQGSLIRDDRVTDNVKIRKIEPLNPESDIIEEAVRIIRRGGIVSFPTRCLYGLGVDALNTDAVERVFQIKQRPFHKPILILVNDQKALHQFVKSVPSTALNLMKNFWPGRVTIIFEAVDSLSGILTGETGKIGVRLPGHPVAFALVNALENPITGTSANLSGQTGCSSVNELDSVISDQLDLILDAGPLKSGIGSTVVDVTVNPPRIVREGEVAERAVFASLDRKV